MHLQNDTLQFSFFIFEILIDGNRFSIGRDSFFLAKQTNLKNWTQMFSKQRLAHIAAKTKSDESKLFVNSVEMARWLQHRSC